MRELEVIAETRACRWCGFAGTIRASGLPPEEVTRSPAILDDRRQQAAMYGPVRNGQGSGYGLLADYPLALGIWTP